MMSAWSDIASMGVIPRWALVSWGLPSHTAVGKALSIYRGMVEATDFVGGRILGGDTVSCEKIIVDVMVVGECINGRYITRRGAKLGDVVAITGVLGKSLAGLIALQRDLPEPSFWREHWYPFPKIKEGRWFCEKGYANSMIDISDGLLSDAKHLAESSNVGINIERDKILVDDELKRFCEKYDYDPIEIFLRSGEEYELLVTISESVWSSAKDEFKNDFGCDLIEIGRVTDEWVGVRINGKEPTFEGYEHFK